MRKQLPLLLLFLLPLFALAQTVVVPKVVQFADIQVRISDRGQDEIQKKVDALHRHPAYFQKKVDLADMYFPIIERVFKEEGVPDDFKYLALQESGLVSDAVSSSNAVGFWQFKIEAANDFQLRVDKNVDERRHIIEATRGAAKYMKRSNSYYKNWLNSLLSYNLGLTGAKSYTKTSEIGSRRMDVTDKTHPYVLTFLAHKIAYENYVGKTKTPPIALQQMRAKPGQSLSDIARATKADPTEVEKYNKWLLSNKVPSDKDYYVMIPVRNGEDRGLLAANTTDDNTDITMPVIFRGFGRNTKNIKAAIVKKNNLNTVVASKGDTQESLAQKAGLSTRRFLKFNDMYSFDKVQPGTAYYIERKKSSADKEFHVVQPGETMQLISQQYGMQLRYLLYKNRMARNEVPVPGRVLWLQKRRPGRVPVEVRDLNKNQKQAAATPDSTTKANALTRFSDSLKKDTAKQEKTAAATQQEAEPTQNVFKRFINSLKRFKQEKALQEEQTEQEEKIEVVQEQPILQEEPVEQTASSADANEKPVSKASVAAAPAATKTTPEKQTDAGKQTSAYPASKAEPAAKPKQETKEVKVASAATESAFEEETTPEPVVVEEQTESSEETETAVNTPAPKPASNKNSTKHIVKQGETLYSISRMYAVSLNDINTWNNLGPDEPIKIDQELLIAAPLTTPSNTETESTTPNNSNIFHTVATGETLYQISRKYNVSLSELRTWNNLSDDNIKVSQKLRVAAPADANTSATPSSSSTKSATQTSYHTVAAGESMYQISRSYGVTIKDIMEWNKKSDFSVSIGEKLLIKKP